MEATTTGAIAHLLLTCLIGCGGTAGANDMAFTLDAAMPDQTILMDLPSSNYRPWISTLIVRPSPAKQIHLELSTVSVSHVRLPVGRADLHASPSIPRTLAALLALHSIAMVRRIVRLVWYVALSKEQHAMPGTVLGWTATTLPL